MKYYRELCVDLPQEYESLRQSVHRFAKEVLRPAAAALDQMAEPREVIAPGSPFWQMLRAAYELGYHAVGVSTEFGGLGLRGLARHILLERDGLGQRRPRHYHFRLST